MFAEHHLTRWHAAFRAGHLALDRNDLSAATRWFQNAVLEAEQLLPHRCEDLPTPRMYVSSYHHLAECYRRVGQDELVFHCLLEAHQRLVRAIRDRCLPLAVRQACVEELRHSLQPLMDSLRQSPRGEREALRLLEESRQLAFGAPTASTQLH